MNRLDLNIPDPVESRRSASGRLVRFTYGFFIISLGLFLAWYFGRQLVILEGPGIVTAKRYVISAPYTTHVLSINISPGAYIKAGGEIATVSSFEVEKHISDLLNVLVAQTTSESELKIKVAVARATQESAKERLSAANNSISRLEGASNPAAATLQYRSEIYRERALSILSLTQSQAEGTEAAAQLSQMSKNNTLITKQLEHIYSNYNDGHLLAPVAGVFSSRMAESGETIIAGGVIAEVYDTKDIYIDWTLPSLRLIQPQVGVDVVISDGSNSYSGNVTEIFEVSGKFADGSRSIMDDEEHGQIARVRADKLDKLVVLNTHVTVRMSYFQALVSLIN